MRLQLLDTLRREEEELLLALLVAVVVEHLHGDAAVQHVHEDVELVQATERRLQALPQGNDEARGCERALTATQA